jgi:peptidyl-prolyl cis-trans isomerase SurA
LTSREVDPDRKKATEATIMNPAISFFWWRGIAIIATIAAVVFWHAEAWAQVVVVVNGEPITAYDVEQRTRLMQLATHKAPARQEVLNELIDDKLKVQIGKRYELEMPDSAVDSAFENVARSSRTTPEQFGKALTAAGVDIKAFKERLRADAVWGQIVRGKFQSSLQVGEKDVFTALESRNKGEADFGFEYRLTPIVFVVPRGSPEAAIEARRREAEALRQRFQDCEEGIPFARALRDVAVREPITRASADLAVALRGVLDGIEVGRLTPPEVTQGGVEMFALCSKNQTTQDTPGKREMRDQMFAQKFQAQAKRYLKELRNAAMIEYR